MQHTKARGRKPIYHSEQERIDARRRAQKKYYYRIKDERSNIIKLTSLRRYYKRILSKESIDNKKYNKHMNKLNEIELKLANITSQSAHADVMPAT